MLAHESTVLLVDGDVGSRAQLADLLRRVGYLTRDFERAEDLLAALDEATTPACVISELALPGMSGIDLTRALRERDLRVPVIILTTHGDVATAVTAMRSDIADYLVKPFVERDLVRRLRTALSRAASLLN